MFYYDTREFGATYVAWELLLDKAEIYVYDPKVSKQQILRDLNYLAEQNIEFSKIKDELFSNLVVHSEPFSTMENAHAIALLTEWEEFKTYEWEKVYENMYKPAFVFDGRNILDAEKLKLIGFEYKRIGKR